MVETVLRFFDIFFREVLSMAFRGKKTGSSRVMIYSMEYSISAKTRRELPNTKKIICLVAV
ncbi:hypothetical protein D3C76_1509240 [compost metagenome]